MYVNDGELKSNEEVYIRNFIEGNSGSAIFIANGVVLTTSSTFTDNERKGSGSGLGGTVHTSSKVRHLLSITVISSPHHIYHVPYPLLAD